MSAKKQAPAATRVELARYLAMPVLLLALITIPWFTGGRDSFGLLLISILSVLLYFSWFIVSRHRALRLSLAPRWIILPLAGLIAGSVLSLIWSVSRFNSLGQIAVLLASGLSFIIARDVFSEDPLAVKFFRALWVLMASLITVIGFGLFVAGDYDRLTSLFYWPNPMATFLMPVLLVTWHSATEVIPDPKTKTNTKLYWAWQLGAGMAAAGLILTYSRAAWLITVIVTGAWIVSSSAWQKRLRIVLVSLLIAVPLMAGLVTARGIFFKKPSINVQARVAEVGQSNSLRDRLAYWRESTAMFSVRPVVGWGIGTYKEVHPAYQENPATAGSNPHNSFLQTMVELGLIGFVSYGALLIGWGMLGWQLYKSGQLETWQMTGWLIVSAIGLHSLVDLVTNYPVLILTGAIWLAMTLPTPAKWFEFRLKSWLFGTVWLFVGIVMSVFAWVTYKIYITSLDKQYIDVVAPFDWPEAQDRYLKLYKSSILDPDYLSYGVIQAVDRFEASAEASPSQLDSWELDARRATKAEPNDAKHWYALGSVVERQGKVTEALNLYRQAIELDPYDNPQYQISYAVLLRREGFTTEAIKTLRSITAAYPANILKDRGISNLPQRLSAAHVLLGDIYHDQADYVAAESELVQAETLNPKSSLVKARRESWSKQ